MQKITPFLWYEGKIDEVVSFHRSIFTSTKVLNTMKGPDGSTMSATVEIEGQQLMLFGGGPHYRLTPAVSLYVNCETQAEVDELWTKLLAGGGQETQCGCGCHAQDEEDRYRGAGARGARLTAMFCGSRLDADSLQCAYFI